MPARLVYDVEKLREQIVTIMRLGATREECATALGISGQTLHRMSLRHQEVAEALATYTTFSDERVVASLFQRAVGFERTVEKIVSTPDGPTVMEYKEFFPPDVGAIRHWLQCRRRAEWVPPSQASMVGFETEKPDGEITRVVFKTIPAPDYDSGVDIELIEAGGANEAR